MQGCNNSTLTLYVPSSENPWDISKIRFIYRRLGFGISNEKAKALLTKSPEELIDEIINSAKMMPLTPAPEWGFWNNDEINNSGNNQGYYKTLWQKQAFSNFLSETIFFNLFISPPLPNKINFALGIFLITYGIASNKMSKPL